MKAPTFLPDCLPRIFLAECGPKGVQGGERKATLLASIDDNFAVSNSPWAGIDAPTPAREQGLQSYGALYCFEWRSEGDWGRAESPQCARRRIPLPCPRWGLTRRFRRGSRACSPMGRSHFSFGGERKVCKRKPAARRLREKALYCPFWRRGSLCRAQRSWPATPAIVRARSSPFSAVKMSGPFSLRCLSPPCPGAVGGGHTQPLQGGMLWRSLCFFARQKASGKSNPRWPCLRAMRPVAEWR